MEMNTTRFGAVQINPDDIILFSAGLLAFEDCRHWILLADAQNNTVGWLQSISQPEIAMAVVSPRRFVPGYQLRVTGDQLAPLQLEATSQAFLLAIVSKNHSLLTLNLKAPLVFNLERRLGRQVIASDDQPLQYELTRQAAPLRQSA